VCVCLFVRTHTQELLPIQKQTKTGKYPKEDAGRASINHSLFAFEKKIKKNTSVKMW